MKDVFTTLQQLRESRTPFVETVLVEARGSTPAPRGARALIGREGLISGTIGGGKVEAQAIRHAQSLLEKRSGEKTDFRVWNLQRDVGMTCGGEVHLYFEVHFASDWKIAVFGAGHVAQALVPLLCQLDCQVFCVDSRSEWLDKLDHHPRLTKLHGDEPARLVSELPEDTFMVLMTQGHASDLPILKEILNSRTAPYVGVIGSRSKSLVLKRDLAEAGISEDKRESFHCPIGLPFGDSSPNEIAISITAQLLSCRDARG